MNVTLKLKSTFFQSKYKKGVFLYDKKHLIDISFLKFEPTGPK